MTLIFKPNFKLAVMKKTSLLIACILTAGMAFGQTVHHIEAGGGPSGPDPYFAPQNVTVEVGDTVRWTNTGGTHNVDGSLATYPNNPEGFRNGDPSNSLWTFDHVFTITGTYDFSCEAFDHATTQFGTITVNEPASVNYEAGIQFNVYPNPATELIEIASKEKLTNVVLYSLDMKKVADLSVAGSGGVYRVVVDGITPGSYMMQCNFNGQLAMRMVVLN